MSVSAPPAAISELRERIARLEGGNARIRTVLPFGVAAIDRVLPRGGLAFGGLHEVAGGGNGSVDGAATALFAAGIARFSMTASRRLQLAAESSGAIGIAIRRWRRQTEATDFGQPTAAETRWRGSGLPSTPLPV